MPDGSIILVEIAAQCLTRIDPDGRREILAHLGGGPNGVAIGPDGHAYVCNNGGLSWGKAGRMLRPTGAAPAYAGGCIQRVDLETRNVEVLYAGCERLPLHGPNDLVFDEHGGFWFSDFGKTFEDRIMRGAIFYARADGSSIERVAHPVLTPNGIGLAPDGRTLYVSETETSRLWSYPLTGPGQLSLAGWPSPNGGRLVHGLAGYQRPDSLALEAGGNVVLATFVEDGLRVFSPAGDPLEYHEAPESFCTNVCFGGPDMCTAYVTLSGLGQLLAVPWPRAGLKLN